MYAVGTNEKMEKVISARKGSVFMEISLVSSHFYFPSQNQCVSILLLFAALSSNPINLFNCKSLTYIRFRRYPRRISVCTS